MNYADKLVKWIESGNRQEYKPGPRDFWYWMNCYDPRTDGLEYVKEDFDWQVWRKKTVIHGVNFYLHFRIRPQYAVCMVDSAPGIPLRQEDISFADMICSKVKNFCHVIGTMQEFTVADSMRQFEIFCNK